MTTGPATLALGACGPSGRITHYRGSIRVEDGASNRVMNRVRIEDYLRGVVPKEISASWADAGGGRGLQAVMAQAVAVRSYALQPGRWANGICDSQGCQGRETSAACSGVGHQPGGGGRGRSVRQRHRRDARQGPALDRRCCRRGQGGRRRVHRVLGLERAPHGGLALSGRRRRTRRRHVAEQEPPVDTGPRRQRTRHQVRARDAALRHDDRGLGPRRLPLRRHLVQQRRPHRYRRLQDDSRLDLPERQRPSVARLHAAKRLERGRPHGGEPAHRAASRRQERDSARRHRRCRPSRSGSRRTERHRRRPVGHRVHDRVAVRRPEARGVEPQLHGRGRGRQRRDRPGGSERQGLHLQQRLEPPAGRHRRLVRRFRIGRRGDTEANPRHAQLHRGAEGPPARRRHHHPPHGRCTHATSRRNARHDSRERNRRRHQHHRSRPIALRLFHRVALRLASTRSVECQLHGRVDRGERGRRLARQGSDLHLLGPGVGRPRRRARMVRAPQWDHPLRRRGPTTTRRLAERHRRPWRGHAVHPANRAGAWRHPDGERLAVAGAVRCVRRRTERHDDADASRWVRHGLAVWHTPPGGVQRQLWARLHGCQRRDRAHRCQWLRLRVHECQCAPDRRRRGLVHRWGGTSFDGNVPKRLVDTRNGIGPGAIG